jgi:hypothetical protein
VYSFTVLAMITPVAIAKAVQTNSITQLPTAKFLTLAAERVKQLRPT